MAVPCSHYCLLFFLPRFLVLAHLSFLNSPLDEDRIEGFDTKGTVVAV